jgi:uncharacterized protein (TIGR02246 family)
MKKTSLFTAALILCTAPLFAQYGEAPVKAGKAAVADEGYDSEQPAAPVKSTKTAGKAVRRGLSGDETGVKDLFSRVSGAWAASDAQKLAGLFTAEDSSYLGPQGMELYGRRELEKFFADELSGAMAGTQQTFSDFNIRFYPLASVALVDCTATLMGQKNTDGTTADLAKTHIFSIAVNRTGKNWQVYLMRVFSFQKPAENEAGVSVTPRKPLSAAPAVAAPAAAAPVAAATATVTTATTDELGLPVLDLNSPPALPPADTMKSGLPMPVATATPTKDGKK